MEFNSSAPDTIGIELELQLLDAHTLYLADGIIPLMEFYPGSEFIKPEFIQNTVEVTTRVCTGCKSMHEQMLALVRDVQKKCSGLGMTLSGAGTHPFDERLGLITPLPRYKRMEKSGGHLSHTQIVFATHVHIGMASGEQAIAVMNQLRAYLPLLIAISANSPFWRGFDTGYVCYRHRILAATRSYGIPPSFESWEHFGEFAETTRSAGIFNAIDEIHWDIRPRPHLGTIEVRVLDAQTTIIDTIRLSAFVRALVLFIRDHGDEAKSPELPQPLPGWLEKENHFQASRSGMAAKYVTNGQVKIRKISDVWEMVAERVRPVAVELGEAAYLDELVIQLEDGPGYQRQRDVFEQTGSLHDVVRDCVSRLDQEL